MKRDTTILRAGEESVVADDDLARISPAVRVETLPKHGHTLHRSAFERFAEAVREAAP
jgi:pimeloyl-ACP methyl ester carboxylesterase